MIFASYYGICNKLPKELVQISISLKPPQWFKGECYTPLAPSESILKEWKYRKDESVYIYRFTNEILAKLDFDEVMRDLVNISNNHSMVLLCYEKSTEPCHRHIVARWMREHGIQCTEISK